MDTKTLIQQRADLYTRIRAYFQQQQVLEVEVPVLGRSGPTDLHLASMQLDSLGQTYYLQTSPEFFLKRLLAAGSGDIYALTKAFRDAEEGRRHNPEFSMLEWYRQGFDLSTLMADVRALVTQVLPGLEFSTSSYADLFAMHLGVNPHVCSATELAELCAVHAGYDRPLEPAACLDLLMAQVIEPRLAGSAHFVVDFPASQAAMAQVAEDACGHRVARRFELYIDGVEIANGYEELTDPREMRARIEADNIARNRRALPQMPVDERFLAALAAMPACAGVALGLDRLLWLSCRQQGLVQGGQVDLSEVVLFPWNQL